jgi:hypothetical protein
MKLLSESLDSRLGRYLIAAGAAAAAAAPAQAAPITVLLPTPVDVRLSYPLDFDQNGSTEVFFSGSGTAGFYACYFGTADIFLDSNGAIRQLSLGALVGLTAPDSFWGSLGTLSVPSTTSPDYFIGVRFASSAGPNNRIGFAQMNGSLLYGFAWEEAPGITTFDLRKSAAEVPEPATGALAALALGALAVAARKRKQT